MNMHLVVGMIVLVVATRMWNKGGVVVVSGQCQGDLPGLMAQCPKYVGRTGPQVEPSKECCDVVKTADVACVCKYITKEIEQIISMEKVVFVAQSCGKPLAHGSKCGSYTVP
ncbi:hypothetical protein CsSME_00011470 [Camellia sinensis var. sinensis]|uniref:uncharacterized protein LOC114313799 n=1 Tax=Camellia sinensis TaxID=4442 RepID=UPI0010357AB5|nr:uncharacterized protein LOC114313799 [Camellia sinensis]